MHPEVELLIALTARYFDFKRDLKFSLLHFNVEKDRDRESFKSCLK